MQTVGFVGVGTMGSLMAANLLRKGFSLRVYDLEAERVRAMVALGAQGVASATEAAAGVDVLITMVPSSPDVEDLLIGSAGVLERMPPGSILIDMSTIDPFTEQRLAKVAGARGVEMLDAPVSGGPVKAKDGTLTIIVGGRAEVLARCQDVLAAMGTNIYHVGDHGMGQIVKLVNNLISAVSMAAVAEAFAFGVKAGADPKTLFEVVSHSTGNCSSLQTRVPYPHIVPGGSPADNDFAPRFPTDLIQKDLGLVLSAGRDLRVPLFMASVAQQLYGATSAAGYGRKDFSAVGKLMQKLAGIE